MKVIGYIVNRLRAMTIWKTISGFLNVPVGYEDSGGFHYGKMPTDTGCVVGH